MGRINHVCIIDDDHIFVYGAKRLMQKLDFYEDLSVFVNGQEALDQLTGMVEAGTSLPSLIFLDLNMPIMNGWEFLEELGNSPGIELNGISIYIMSSSVDPRELQRIQQYPVVKDYVLKPMTLVDLEKVRSQLI